MSEIPLARPFLEHDILCIGCGYNLRGLSEPGRCPECGLDIGNSLRGDLLAGADSAWLKKLNFGVTLKLWSIVISIFGSFILGMIFSFIGAFGAPPMLLFVLAGVGGLIGLLATFSITSQEPRMTLSEDEVTPRRLLRTCALIATFGGLPEHLMNSAVVHYVPILDSELFWVFVGVLAGLAGIVVFFGELGYLRTFALRAPNLKLAKSTRVLMWVLGIGMLIAVVFGAVLSLARGSAAGGTGGAGFGSGFELTLILGCMGATAGVILFIWYIVLLIRYRRMFMRAITESAGRGAPSVMT